MAAPSYTYTLANSTTADADEVMQNFNDILNGVSDGSKDLSIAALTVAGAAQFNGAVTLGNATGDDLTPTGRWAADMDPKTAATYALGSSSLPWQSVNVDNGATDGGAIYYGGTSTDFLKSSVDGDTLNIGGFSKMDSDANLERKGRINADDAATGYIGEKITWSSAPSSQSLSSSSLTLWTNATITLTAGTWLVVAGIQANYTSGTSSGNVGYARIAVTNTSGTVIQTQDQSIYGGDGAGSENGIGWSTASFAFVVSVSSNTTYEIRGAKVDLSGTAANCTVRNESAAQSHFFGLRIA